MPNINLNPDSFTFSIEIQIRWFDLDPFNHVNNSVYFQYFEIARSRYIRKVSNSWDWQQNQFVLAQTSCDFMKEIKLDQKNPRVWVRVNRLGSKSFDLKYMITSDNAKGDLVVHSAGSSVQVMIDAKAGGTMKIPDWLKDEFQKFEKPGTIEGV